MAFIFRPICKFYSASDVKKIVRQAVEQTTVEMLDRQIADLELLQKELDQLDRHYE